MLTQSGGFFTRELRLATMRHPSGKTLTYACLSLKTVINLMKNFFILSFVLLCVLVSPLVGGEPRPSLKQLIADSKERDGRWHPRVLFSPIEVRKRFYGDEVAFVREVGSLLQTGEATSIRDAYEIIHTLGIGDESVLKVLREQFSSVGTWLQIRFCSILATHPSEENVIFLLDVFEQSDNPIELRVHAAYCLSYFLTELGNFECLEDELKERILHAFLAHLDSDEEFQQRFFGTAKFGDSIAALLGHFGSFAKVALPKIREKFISAQDWDVQNKLQLAWAIVRIDPESCAELKYILQKAVEHESDFVRMEAIVHLETVPPILSEKVIPHLITIIQEDEKISNKRLAAQAIHTLLGG